MAHSQCRWLGGEDFGRVGETGKDLLRPCSPTGSPPAAHPGPPPAWFWITSEDGDAPLWVRKKAWMSTGDNL